MALRYLRHLGADTVAIKPWATYAMRCMFGINKKRADLRNHAVDAFIVAHFDDRVLRPAFDLDRLRANNFEELYATRALSAALSSISGGSGFLDAFEQNLARLDHVLRTIATAHRPDNRWNPGDALGGSFGALGGENIYAFRPTWEQRKELTRIAAKAGKAPPDGRVMTRRDLLELLNGEPRNEAECKLQLQLRAAARLRYRSKAESASKVTRLNADTAEPLTRQPGAFIDAAGKFAVVGPIPGQDRTVVTVAGFSRMSAVQREALLTNGRAAYRRGDIVLNRSNAYVVTGLQADGRLIVYPIDAAERKTVLKDWITIPAKSGSKKQPPTKAAYDVLGRRLHRLRKGSGGLEPVSYRLRER